MMSCGITGPSDSIGLRGDTDGPPSPTSGDISPVGREDAPLKKCCKVNPAICFIQLIKKKENIKNLKFIIIFFDNNIVLHLLIYFL